MLRRLCSIKPLHQYYLPRLNYSNDAGSKIKNLPNEYIIFNGDTIVCWHPEPIFPYECSKQLPPKKPEVESASILKMTKNEAQKMFAREKKRPIICEELAKLTYTTKHIWFPRARDKRAKTTIPNRPYL